eukprot:TRINITY_DN1240_c1_g1_i1.p1 TRINITY_DN1240_c1_g1~~TRINITY_DN1240_c1_g1_i1.p1  ORF type:complete len:267 (+),score=142.09 TRINITY_DN1240_c1_g1_i1:131-931(+)
MARRYDSRTTIFSPEGRLYQVEYAIEAISHASSAVGILTKEGVVLAAEKKITSKLVEVSSKTEKMYQLADHLACAVAGITADANILINFSRVSSQQYLHKYQQPIPIEQLVQQVCDWKQYYTQIGGLRPFGVAFLYAGYDDYFKFQLYQSDPSGTYGGWKATAIGANNQSAQSTLKQEYRDDMSLDDALKLAIKVLSKTIDSTDLNANKLEIGTLTLDPVKGPRFQIFNENRINDLVQQCDIKSKRDDDDDDEDRNLLRSSGMTTK